jgi:Tfp pilus assembly protein PilN
MREIDLIPREHVEQRQRRRILMRAGAAIAALLLVTVAARVAIGMALMRERPLAEQQRHDQRVAGTQRAQLAELSARKADIEARLAVWKQLQQPAPWRPALSRIDGAFGRGLWFDQLALRRAPAAAGPRAASGPAPAAAALPTQQQLIEIKGHAFDHAALTAFTRALGEQPGLHGVRLMDTGLRRYSTAEVVDFTVSARLTAPPGGSP